MTSPQIIKPSVGDNVYLGSFFANIHAFGTVTDLDTPAQASMSIEVQGSNAVLSVPVLMGNDGPAGQNAFILKLQQQVYDDPDELPTNLTEDDVDVGKYWIVREFDEDENPVSSKAFVWYGDHYEWFPMGTQGPVGPPPIVSWSFDLVESEVTAPNQTKTTKTGDDYHPSILVEIDKEVLRGPQGEMGDMEDLENWDGSSPSEVGDVAIFDGTNWKPGQASVYIPRFYTYPEGSFSDVSLAFGTRVPIGTALIPPQEWDCVPMVEGHFRVLGVEFDTTPLMIGVEVRLGSVNGTLVARGWGNITNYVTVRPHASTGSAPNDAITPTNGRAVIPQGATGADATLYVNCFNDGVAGLYNFENAGAQLSVLCIPVP